MLQSKITFNTTVKAIAGRFAVILLFLSYDNTNSSSYKAKTLAYMLYCEGLLAHLSNESQANGKLKCSIKLRETFEHFYNFT